MEKITTLIIGASSAIAKSLCEKLIGNQHTQVILVSRDLSDYKHLQHESISRIIVDDYSAASIEDATSCLKEFCLFPITQVFICHGILHTKTIQPEKRLEDFDSDAFQQVITANALTPILWIKHLTPMITGKLPCTVTCFSARVGSISDNRLGGWYSYRASKAALNMMLKTSAVELARRAKNVKLIAFHPGTTDTPLSKPFQNNVAEGKLFTCDFVANQLLNIVKNTSIDGTASFVDWQGAEISW